ncbi:hypothetical protein HC031_29025 [Planosporangium thailandense]|uniref:Uncharacterized protein n=1 Tax=Planosporangium thailandense TaxID=765197 RepID=A0ABX0Y5P8_9ACTN|nr:hypothetical protein [Planosporangium thailandense]NJC73731.1 hypothetical protein [Planosporangium thailandense]
MRFFVALVVFVFGFGLYAVAALLFDRRHVLAGWHAARRAQAAGEAEGSIGRAPIAVRMVSALPPWATVAGCLVLGTLLMLGACAGLIVW